jgi:signal transduction histidine kinase
LPYGDHLLRIKAQGSDGIWSVHELTVPIRVVRPVHLRWWFIALCALAVSALVYAIFRYRLDQAKKVLAMRDRIAADLHDEVGSSLSNIAMFGELMRDQLADQPPKVRRMVDRITSNSAKALEGMNDIVWNVNTRSEGTEHLVARMRSFAAQAAEAKGFVLRFEVAGDLRAVKLDMMHRKHLYLIFKEAVNNAAKYSGCTELQVSLTAQGNGIRLVVGDNGRGFAEGEQDARGGGQGLSGMRKRAAEIGAGITVLSVVGEGTTIILSPEEGGVSRTLGTRPTGGNGSFAP